MNLGLAVLLAGGVAVAVTRAVERWGGAVGGLLGTLPSTIVPASLGLWAASPAGFAEAMGVIPAGMLLNAGFLWLWRVLPPRAPAWGLAARLGWTSAVSLAIWGVAAAALGGLVTLAKQGGVPAPVVGACGLGVGVIVGVVATLTPVPAPRGGRQVAAWVLLARAGLAGGAVAAGIALASAGVPVLSGLATVFPAIFLTTMVALWWSQGESVPAGAVGPMMLGACSIGTYALASVWTFPAWGPAWGALGAWSLAAGGVSLPAAGWLALRRRARSPRSAPR